MMEFEALMQQMMEVKAMNTSSNERKQKAEELIRKLTKNLGLMRSGLLWQKINDLCVHQCIIIFINIDI